MWTHRFAVATLCATILLLLIGGIVHGTGSSLACPDWPLCFGSLFPEMKGNVLVEHGHRLAATTVGVLTIILCVLLRFRSGGHDRRLSGLGLLALFTVCFQGVLGGLTVIYRLPTLVSTAHLMTSMVFLGLLSVIAALTRRDAAVLPVPARPRRLLLLGTTLLYLQISLGGLVRHTGAGLACLDVPLCRGRLLPLGEPPAVWLQVVHRANALVVATVLCVAMLHVQRALRGRSMPWLRTLVLAVPWLLAVQVGLGLMSVLSYLGLFYVTAHLGVAALLLYAMVTLCVRTMPSDEEQP